MKPFHVVVLILFGFMALGGILLLSQVRTPNPSAAIGTVAIWGTLPADIVTTAIKAAGGTGDALKNVKYSELDPRTFTDTYIRALADGKGPDLILLPHEDLYGHVSTLYPLPYEMLSERDFKDTYIQAGEIYLTSVGVAGIPFTIDPMVLYWNRSLLQTQGLSQPPATWTDVYRMAPKLSESDERFALSRSAIALGEIQNIEHAKEIIVSLFMQLGSNLIRRNADGSASAGIVDRGSGGVPFGNMVVTLFTEFSNPQKDVYSWNRSLPEAKEAFISGELALYLGFASEVKEIRATNPNLNYDIAPFPQIAGSPTQANYARLTAFALPKASKNLRGAYAAARLLTSKDVLRALTEYTGLPPVNRALLSEPEENAYKIQFNKAALISRAWLDPNPEESDRIFSTLVENVKSGRLSLSDAVKAADVQLTALLGQ